MNARTDDEVREKVREHYGKVAEAPLSTSCAPGCCGVPTPGTSLALGYSKEDLAAVPEGANLGLGCGNPQTIAALRPGEVVLDLGSGGGFDAFLAARAVGPEGRVVGVDMTASMIGKARANAERLALGNVEFRLGEIEHLPVEAGSVDVIISNCVVNLSPNKRAVFEEAFRVLKPGGRIAISDVVLLQELPASLGGRVEALTGCVAGAVTTGEVERTLESAGFEAIRVVPRPESRAFIREWLPDSGAEDYVASATIEASRPKTTAACCGPACCEDKPRS